MAGLLASASDTDALPMLASLACEVHGCAASIAQARFGSRGVMAADIIDTVGLAVDAVEDRAAFSDADDDADSAQDEGSDKA